jgi:hypothetical protein
LKVFDLNEIGHDYNVAKVLRSSISAHAA